MPDEQRIRQIVQDEIRAQGNRDTFSGFQTTRHIHNGVDAPYVYDSNALFAGVIITSEFPALLPKGWTITKVATGTCDVTHNLGEVNQIVWVASAIGAGGATLPVPIIVGDKNRIEFAWFDANAAAAPIDTTFFFIGLQVNNKDYTPNQYSVA